MSQVAIYPLYPFLTKVYSSFLIFIKQKVHIWWKAKQWKHFQFYMFCQASSQILDRLFLDFGKVKNIFVLKDFIKSFNKRLFRGRTINEIWKKKTLLIALHHLVQQIIWKFTTWLQNQFLAILKNFAITVWLFTELYTLYFIISNFNNRFFSFNGKDFFSNCMKMWQNLSKLFY